MKTFFVIFSILSVCSFGELSDRLAVTKKEIKSPETVWLQARKKWDLAKLEFRKAKAKWENATSEQKKAEWETAKTKFKKAKVEYERAKIEWREAFAKLPTEKQNLFKKAEDEYNRAHAEYKKVHSKYNKIHTEYKKTRAEYEKVRAKLNAAEIEYNKTLSTYSDKNTDKKTNTNLTVKMEQKLEEAFRLKDEHKAKDESYRSVLGEDWLKRISVGNKQFERNCEKQLGIFAKNILTDAKTKMLGIRRADYPDMDYEQFLKLPNKIRYDMFEAENSLEQCWKISLRAYSNQLKAKGNKKKSELILYIIHCGLFNSSCPTTVLKLDNRNVLFPF